MAELADREFWQRWAEWVLDQHDAPQSMRGAAEEMLDRIATFDALKQEKEALDNA